MIVKYLAMKKESLLLITVLLSLVAFSNVNAQEKAKARTFDYPFIFGAQYYRAPTPSSACWDRDLKHISDLGFTDVKFWVQWRWSHRGRNSFYFNDLDSLMNIAAKYNLRVTLNTIFDVAPIWLYKKYPDAKQITNDGHAVEPYVVSFRQLGGFPGPCYNHPKALQERKKFMREAILHFKHFKNLAFWDVWNEPELSFPQREAKDLDKLVCYCPNCISGFQAWLKNKYKSIEKLNAVWGRCYANWDEIEAPKNTQTFKDFIDWREFHIHTMSSEAKWRLEMAKELDPTRICYLHVVPNTMQPFNSVGTCTNDFEVAKDCDVFAATLNNGTIFPPQVISAGRGKICYNVESHINGGITSMHQPIINLPELLNDFIPQIGLGIKGFLFWQYHAETLGAEAPAWGLVNLDGSDRPVTYAAETLWKTIRPYTGRLMKSTVSPAQVGIWKSQKNEIFHYCMFGNFNSLANGVKAYADFLYNHNYNYCFTNSELSNLNDLKLLIMPSCYYLTESEAKAIDEWVQKGGVLLSEAHLGGYNDETGRHNEIIPGFGLAEKWGIKEVESTTTYRLRLDMNQEVNVAMSPDVRKMLSDFGTTGGEFVPIKMNDNKLLWGALRYARLKADGAEALGYFDLDLPCVIKKKVGKGVVFYCASNIGEGSVKDKSSFSRFMSRIMTDAKVDNTLGSSTDNVRMDALYENTLLSFITIRNLSDKDENVKLNFQGKARGLFTSKTIDAGESVLIPKGFCDLFVVQ